MQSCMMAVVRDENGNSCSYCILSADTVHSLYVHGSREVMSAIRTAEIDNESLSKMFQSTYLSQLVQYLSLGIVHIQSSCVLRCCLHVCTVGSWLS